MTDYILASTGTLQALVCKQLYLAQYFMSALELLLQEESLNDSCNAFGGPNPEYHFTILLLLIKDGSPTDGAGRQELRHT